MTKFGRKSKPFFKVIGWRGGGPEVIDQRGGGPRDGGPTPALVENTTPDDEVPF